MAGGYSAFRITGRAKNGVDSALSRRESHGESVGVGVWGVVCGPLRWTWTGRGSGDDARERESRERRERLSDMVMFDMQMADR